MAAGQEVGLDLILLAVIPAQAGTAHLALELEKGTLPHARLVISSARKLKRIELGGKQIQSKRSGTKYVIELPDYDAPAQLVMHW